MKKAKIFLTALTVLAVVGGALAFNVKKIDVEFGVCDLNAGVCTLNTFTTKETTTIAGQGEFKEYDLTTATCDEQNPCETFVRITN